VNIRPILFENEMRDSYLSYALSVVTNRAVPDVRDGVKPVHRRILWSFKEMNFLHNKPHRKSARLTGDVTGKYHPHGTVAVYDAMIRMSQEWSMRVPLVDCQGNNGSIDGDKPAAERYTEARLTLCGEMLLQDIEEGVVDFAPNYDNSFHEPTVLPAPYPALLINGSSGIAVGMSTNIPTHNPGEALRAAIALLKNPQISLDEIMQIIPAPDFPTAGMLSPGRPLRDAYECGKGSVYLRGECTVTEDRIVIDSIPYMVNKAKLVERIAELIQDKTIEGISDLRDESDRRGLRVVIELKRGVCAETIRSKLYTMTNMQVNVSIQMTAIYRGRPKQMGLLEILQIFLDFREEVIIRRTQFRLKRVRARMHILSGWLLALDAIDTVIAIIRGADDAQDAREKLCAMEWSGTQCAKLAEITGEALVRLTETQAQSILDLKLQRLTRLEGGQILDELRDLVSRSEGLYKILSDRKARLGLLEEELRAVLKVLDTPRRTRIQGFDPKPGLESMIAKEDMIVTVTVNGHVKRSPLDAYHTQHRGGKGKAGIKSEEVLSKIFTAHTLQEVLFFSEAGKAYSKKVYELPQAAITAKGKSLLSLIPEDNLSAILPLLDEDSDKTLLFVTQQGKVRRNLLSDFANLRCDGKIAMKLSGGDKLMSVQIVPENADVILATERGKLIKFPVDEVRVMNSRESMGVRGMSLDEDDKVVSAFVLAEDTNILTVSKKGYGKRTHSSMFRVAHRGGKGATSFGITKKTGAVAAALPTLVANDVILMTSSGQAIRIKSEAIRETGRCAQGVQLLKTDGEVTQAIATEAYKKEE
jgi:DNA gyrase subunit A